MYKIKFHVDFQWNSIKSPEFWKNDFWVKTCMIDHRSFCLFPACRSVDAESGRSITKLCVLVCSVQYAVCGSGWAGIKSYFVYLWKWPRRLWLGTVRLLTNQHSFMSISSSEGSRTTNKKVLPWPPFSTAFEVRRR